MATIGALVWFERGEIERISPHFRERLTITPTKGFDAGPDPEPIEQWVESRGRIGVPINFGLSLVDHVEENLSKGTKLVCQKRPDPNHPSAPKGQAGFFSDIIQQLKGSYTALVEAPTGSGKTVAVLNAVAEFQRSALIIVPSKTLMYQWAEEAKRHLGLTDEQIGLIGDGKEQLGRPFTICVLHNLFLKIYPQDFYLGFGFVAWDEAHNLGAREFSKTMRYFPATYRIAVTATPDRKDGCAKIFTNYFGEVCVKSEQKPLPLVYTLVPFKLKGTPYSLEYTRSNVKPLLWMSEHEERNKLIVSLIQDKYAEGHTVLVLTKYTKHAQELMELSAKLNGRKRIPENVMGLFTGKRIVDTPEGPKEKAIKKAELDNVKEHATVIFATYSMMKEGVDIPRITLGIEALPISDVRQAVGRARRVYPGKSEAWWISIKDTGIRPNSVFVFLYQFTSARLRSLKKVGGVTINEAAL
jgi:superfamily II DNA or RNA helicase